MKPTRETIEPPRAARSRFQLLRAAALAALTGMAPCAAAQGEGAQAVAQAPATTVVSPALERRIREARTSGAWIVEEGEHLYTIARYFAADEAEAHRLAREIAASNPAALVAGDPARLLVGSRLRLPPRVMGAQSAPTSPGTLPDAVGAPAIAAAAPLVKGPPVYVDRLIGGAQAELEEQREEAEERDLTPGVRATAIEYRLDRRQQTNGDLAIAQGVALRHHAETERLGDFTLEAEVGRESNVLPAPFESLRTVGRATLYHDQFALAGSLVAASALGAIRIGASPWLASSYRIHLPSSVAAGASTVLDSPGLQLRASYGRLSRLGGVAIQHLESVPGSLAMLEATSRLAEGWRVGGSMLALRNAASVPDHLAATLAAEFVPPRGGARLKLQAVADDRGHQGFWGDGEYRYGRLAQRFGAFHIEPGTLFGEGTLPRDSRGAYWRGEYRIPLITSSFGVEASETNLDRDPARGGVSALGGFGTFALKLDRSTQVGAGLSLRHETPRVERGTRRQVALATAFVSRAWAAGFSRLDLAVNATRPRGLPSESTRTLTLNHDWPRWGSIEASTLLSVSDERLAERTVRRTTAGVALRGPALQDAYWNASYTFVDVDDPLEGQRNYNAVVGIDWSPARRWVLKLQWLRNQIEPTAANAFLPFVRENALQVSARYEETQGTPYPRVHAAGGRSGTGWIEGVVFFDDNGDGVRQANERGAPGVMVVLDGRSMQVTDAAGRYNFGLVASGEHGISLSVERIALPWGLQDESARRVRVQVREGARLDVGLTRIAP